MHQLEIRSLSVRRSLWKFTTEGNISAVYCGTDVNLAKDQILVGHLADLPDRFLQP